MKYTFLGEKISPRTAQMNKFRFIDWFLAFYCLILTLLCIKTKIDSILNYGTLTQDPAAMQDKYSNRLLFISGMAGSGMGLLGAMMEGHPSIECGVENGVFIDLVQTWKTYDPDVILDPGLTNETVDEALSLFMLIMVAEQTVPHKILCHKDPYIAGQIVYFRHLFPKAKFLMLIRDGRAVVNSMVSGNVDSKNLTAYRSTLIEWNRNVETMLNQCVEVGSDACMVLYYELLVNEPEMWLRKVARFMNLEYHDSMLNYREKLASRELKVIDMIQPMNANVTRDINNGSFYRWLYNMPNDMNRMIRNYAPILRYLGYDTENKIPDYSTNEELLIFKKANSH